MAAALKTESDAGHGQEATAGTRQSAREPSVAQKLGVTPVSVAEKDALAMEAIAQRALSAGIQQGIEIERETQAAAQASAKKNRKPTQVVYDAARDFLTPPDDLTVDDLHGVSRSVLTENLDRAGQVGSTVVKRVVNAGVGFIIASLPEEVKKILNSKV